MKKALNLGCGMKKIEEAINVDKNPVVKPDIVADINEIPFPFRNDTFDTIYLYDVLEHLDDPMEVIKEIHRILKKDGKVIFTTPHFSSSNSFADPTHKGHFSLGSFDFFTGKRGSFYTSTRFKIKRRKIFFHRLFFPIQAFANKYPDFYEKYLFQFFPANHIYIELEAIK